MSWRRRVLGSTILLGAAVFCIRPILTKGIGNRLAEQWKMPVSIGDSHFDLSDNVVYLSKLKIDDPDCPMIADEVAIKLDGNALLYRNCIVESLVGKGLVWTLPIVSSPPLGTSVDSVMAESENPLLTNLASIFSDAAKDIRDCEREAQERTREIDRQLANLAERVHDFANQSQHPNRLRESAIVKKLRSEIVYIEQLMAEDRIKARQAEQIVSTSTKRCGEFVAKAETTTPVPPVSTESVLENCKRQIIDIAVRNTQPYAVAAEVGYGRLLNQLGSRGSGPELASSQPIRSGRDLVSSTLPPRERKLTRAKLEGVSVLGEHREAIEVMISPVRIQQSERNMVNLHWSEIGQSQSRRETHCRIGPANGTDSEQHELYLEQIDDQSKIVRQSSIRDGIHTRTLMIPVNRIANQLVGFREQLIKELKAEFDSQSVQHVIATNMTPQTEPTGGTIGEWILSESSKKLISDAVSKAVSKVTEEEQSRVLNACRAELVSKKRQLESKQAAFDESQTSKQQEWQKLLTHAKEMVESIGTQTQSAGIRTKITR